MIRLFKHYVPNAVLLLGIMDFVLLLVSAELGWVYRLSQIGSIPEPMTDRIPQLLAFAVALEVAMIAVGVYAAYYILLGVARTWVEQGTADTMFWVPALLFVVVVLAYAPWRRGEL